MRAPDRQHLLIPWWILISFLVSTARAEEPTPKPGQPAFLDNGLIRIGVGRGSGGSIFHFSRSEKLEGGPRGEPRNVLNHYDRGRFIQQSYYGRRDGSVWKDTPWRWNPIQGGDYLGKPARTLEFKIEKDSLYSKSIPVNWAGGQRLEECRMESWIHLHDDIAHLRFRFSYRGSEKHPARHQEMPAVFVDSTYKNLVHYAGQSPWTGAELSRSVPGWPNEMRKIDEHWAAFVDDQGKGIGVFVPGTDEITTYRHPGKTGPRGSGCSYFAAIRTLAIEPGTTIDYHAYLTLGTVREIRSRFAVLAGDLEKKANQGKGKGNREKESRIVNQE